MTTINRLLQQHRALLLDAYGVLLDKQGALPGARALLQRLEAEQYPYRVLTNAASRPPEGLSEDFSRVGLTIPPERITTSATLLDDYFKRLGLQGERAVVLGPEESRGMVAGAGVEVAPLEPGVCAPILVVADQKGFDCLEAMNTVLSMLLERIEKGLPITLLLCNPDLIYPIDRGRYGFTAGGLAAMLEAVLQRHYPELELRFTALGKPHCPIFDTALEQLGTRDAVMIGDQLATDIAGANGAGIASALVKSGLGLEKALYRDGERPTYLLNSLE